ncbi:MAG TPA: peptidylprolyl isomerase, partial [Gemmatimonadales bacterium]|nr:peptidylprolyl isomerase [Gemmatimonadales bacterium]
VDSANIAEARNTADSVRVLLAKGASFDSLQRLYHDRSAERAAENVPADKLPEAYAKVIAESDSGAVLPVFTLPSAGGRDQFVVLQVTARRPAGDIRYEDVKDRIRSQLGQELAIRRYLDKLRKGTYVDVRS